MITIGRSIATIARTPPCALDPPDVTLGEPRAAPARSAWSRGRCSVRGRSLRSKAAGGLSRALAQQLVAADETVVRRCPSALAARTLVLERVHAATAGIECSPRCPVAQHRGTCCVAQRRPCTGGDRMAPSVRNGATPKTVATDLGSVKIRTG